MAFLGRINLSVLAVAALLAVNGCSPADSSQSDEENEPHFVLGNSRFNEMDWPGAIEAFEESLEVNPHSAQAHYRLAQLFDSKQPDPAAAIYHYEQYLKLNPDANNRDVIKQRIDSCKQQLATDVLQLPSAPAVQKQLDSLVDQNRQLQSQVDQLNGVIKQWNIFYASLKASQAVPPQNSVPATPNNSPTPDDISTPVPQPVAHQTTPTSTATKPVATRPPKSRTHIIASGETLAGIARKSGVSLSSLLAANPNLNPKKLHVGQPVNLPP